jgi:hypothetical protein
MANAAFSNGFNVWPRVIKPKSPLLEAVAESSEYFLAASANAIVLFAISVRIPSSFFLILAFCSGVFLALIRSRIWDTWTNSGASKLSGLSL